MSVDKPSWVCHPVQSLCDSQYDIPSPSYVIDIAAIKCNMAIVDRLKASTGCKVLLATKAFACAAVFAYMREHLDGTTASGLFEARLGAEHFGKEVHCYSPAYSDRELEQVLDYANHIYFNSLEQYERYVSSCERTLLGCTGPQEDSAELSARGPAQSLRDSQDDIQYGLRINPEFSQVINASIYDPSAPNSRFGVPLSQMPDTLPEAISILHIHNLCENMAEDSVALINHLIEHAGHLLQQIDTLNLGGGHYITHPEYNLDALIDAINMLKEKYALEVILEPGGALVYEAGYLVSTVLDIIDCHPVFIGGSGNNNKEIPQQVRDDRKIAILDTSATCHMPDVLEMPYTPNVVGAICYPVNRASDRTGPQTEHTHYAAQDPALTDNACALSVPQDDTLYTLTGKTCLTGDIIGTYHFSKPLKIGQKIIFTDMAQYSFVKNTTFNGLPLPSLALLHEEGTVEVVKEFGYDNFAERVG